MPEAEGIKVGMAPEVAVNLGDAGDTARSGTAASLDFLNISRIAL